MELSQVTLGAVLPARFRAVMGTHHYLGAAPKVGETLWYGALWRGEWVALASFSAAALKCQARDAWIGWTLRHKYDRLHLVANVAARPVSLGSGAGSDHHVAMARSTGRGLDGCAVIAEEWFGGGTWCLHIRADEEPARCRGSITDPAAAYGRRPGCAPTLCGARGYKAIHECRFCAPGNIRSLSTYDAARCPRSDREGGSIRRAARRARRGHRRQDHEGSGRRPRGACSRRPSPGAKKNRADQRSRCPRCRQDRHRRCPADTDRDRLARAHYMFVAKDNQKTLRSLPTTIAFLRVRIWTTTARRPASPTVDTSWGVTSHTPHTADAQRLQRGPSKTPCSSGQHQQPHPRTREHDWAAPLCHRRSNARQTRRSQAAPHPTPADYLKMSANTLHRRRGARRQFAGTIPRARDTAPQARKPPQTSPHTSAPDTIDPRHDEHPSRAMLSQTPPAAKQKSCVSGGQQQRVALARAVQPLGAAHEPLSALDASFVYACVLMIVAAFKFADADRRRAQGAVRCAAARDEGPNSRRRRMRHGTDAGAGMV